MGKINSYIRSRAGRTDWALLLFITGVTYSKIYIKLAALLVYAVYLLWRKYSWRQTPGKISWFYLLMPVAGMISPAVQGSFQQQGYWLVVAWGALFWCTAAAAFHLLYVRVKSGPDITATVKTFFLLNLFVSLAQLVRIIVASGALVPYWYYDAADVYGASTGDYITGIFGAASVVNATVSALGVLWFLYRRHLGMAAVCICSMMLCTSNITIGVCLLVCGIMAVTVKQRKLRLATIGIIVLSMVSYVILSPANLWYIQKVWNRLLHPQHVTEQQLAGPDFKGHFFLQEIPANIYSGYRQDMVELQSRSATDTSRHNLALGRMAVRELIQHWYSVPADSTPLAYWEKPGKIYAAGQTLFYLKSGMRPLLVGAGIGNFSSRLAIKASGTGIEGYLPGRRVYIARDFMSAHLYTILYYYAQPAVAHSMMNMPNSVYHQLAGEYGLAGIALFVLLYLGYWLQHRRRLKAAGYLLVAMLLFFAYEYWFEMISLTVIFELLSLTDIFSNTNHESIATTARNGADAGI